MIEIGQTLALHERFADGFVSAVGKKMRGRQAIARRLFTVMGYPDPISKVEVEFVAPTTRHKAYFHSFDVRFIERELEIAKKSREVSE